jgi:hypothetical protein
MTARRGCLRVLEAVQRLIVIACDQHSAPARQQIDKDRLQLVEVLVLVDDDQWECRDLVLVVTEMQQDAAHRVRV